MFNFIKNIFKGKDEKPQPAPSGPAPAAAADETATAADAPAQPENRAGDAADGSAVETTAPEQTAEAADGETDTPTAAVETADTDTADTEAEPVIPAEDRQPESPAADSASSETPVPTTGETAASPAFSNWAHPDYNAAAGISRPVRSDNAAQTWANPQTLSRNNTVQTESRPQAADTAVPTPQPENGTGDDTTAQAPSAAANQPAAADIADTKENTAAKQPETNQSETKQPEAETKQPETETKQPETETKQPETETKQPETETQQPETETQPEKQGWAARLKQGLSKSRDHMAKSLAGVFGGGKIDEDLYEELETVLLTSDMGIEATEELMEEVRRRVSLRGLSDGAELREALKEAVYELIKPLEQPLVLPEKGPFVIMMAGINGAGKTTSIGKLAKYFQQQGKSVLLAAGDTFRAAAREQLQEWGERNGVTVISQASGDSAAVCFDAVEAAKARGIDIVLADTAGRLPTQLHLMEEIKKVKRVLQKAMPDAPHEIIVVLDANIGQNAVNQVAAFDDALGLTGLIVTKLDGTAKGGVLAALAKNRAIPVRYIGVGEKIDDLRPFDARAFVDALLD